VTNAKGLKLQCGHYRPCDTAETQLPCVVYLHGNSGCQRDCCEVLRPLLSANITVFALDFSGSGLSDGATAPLNDSTHTHWRMSPSRIHATVW